jgi:hypothetical protein
MTPAVRMIGATRVSAMAAAGFGSAPRRIARRCSCSTKIA